MTNLTLLTIAEMFGFLVLIGICTYFLPTFIAFSRNKSNKISILLLNVFLGWTLVGWIVALIWAVSNNENNTNVIINQQLNNGFNTGKSNELELKKCPACAEEIKLEAKKCKHCNEQLT
jgi:Superinfection immunity protein